VGNGPYKLKQFSRDQKIELECAQRTQQEAFKNAQSLFARSLPPCAQNLSPKVISTHPYVVFQECDISLQQKLTQEMVDSLVQRITHV